eukprot:TRINITY_DN60983_c0_g1_i1.p1 TRINITY_DN60983_c0_g1~~TRINITY_DN60983_c0_g1_i1.p1  ORF type:complete len:1100 (+),score=299.10 TRINITY_DN60983_c0_g1_i1:97-3396(+)
MQHYLHQLEQQRSAPDSLDSPRSPSTSPRVFSDASVESGRADDHVRVKPETHFLIDRHQMWKQWKRALQCNDSGEPTLYHALRLNARRMDDDKIRRAVRVDLKLQAPRKVLKCDPLRLDPEVAPCDGCGAIVRYRDAMGSTLFLLAARIACCTGEEGLTPHRVDNAAAAMCDMLQLSPKLVHQVHSEGPPVQQRPGCCGGEPQNDEHTRWERYRGVSALHLAVIAGKTKLIRALLDAGAPLHQRAIGMRFSPKCWEPPSLTPGLKSSNAVYAGEFPLSFAALRGDRLAARLLIHHAATQAVAKKKGVQPERDDTGRPKDSLDPPSPHETERYGAEAALFLIKRADSFGNTALHLTVLHQHSKTFSWLVQQVHTLATNARTMRIPQHEADRLLTKRGTHGCSALHMAAALGNAKMFEAWCECAQRMIYDYGKYSCTELPLGQFDTVQVTQDVRAFHKPMQCDTHSAAALVLCNKHADLARQEYVAQLMQRKWDWWARWLLYFCVLVKVVTLFLVALVVTKHNHTDDDGRYEWPISQGHRAYWHDRIKVYLLLQSIAKLGFMTVDFAEAFLAGTRQSRLREVHLLRQQVRRAQDRAGVRRHLMSEDTPVDDSETEQEYMARVMACDKQFDVLTETHMYFNDQFHVLGAIATVMWIFYFSLQAHNSWAPRWGDTIILAIYVLVLFLSLFEYTFVHKPVHVLAVIIATTFRNEVGRWMLCMAVFFLAFTLPIYVLSDADNRELPELWDIMWRFSVAGNVGDDYTEWTKSSRSGVQVVLWLLYYLCTIFFTVFMMNLLVSMLSSVYDDNKDQGDKLFHLYRGRWILRMERRWRWVARALDIVCRSGPKYVEQKRKQRKGKPVTEWNRVPDPWRQRWNRFCRVNDLELAKSLGRRSEKPHGADKVREWLMLSDSQMSSDSDTPRATKGTRVVKGCVMSGGGEYVEYEHKDGTSGMARLHCRRTKLPSKECLVHSAVFYHQEPDDDAPTVEGKLAKLDKRQKQQGLALKKMQETLEQLAAHISCQQSASQSQGPPTPPPLWPQQPQGPPQQHLPSPQPEQQQYVPLLPPPSTAGAVKTRTLSPPGNSVRALPQPRLLPVAELQQSG